MELNIDEILGYSYKELVSYLRFGAGLSNPGFGGPISGFVGAKDNLDLEQIPEEFANLLHFLRDRNAESYLEVGIGKGGSFLLNCLFQQNLKTAHAVDCCEYGNNSTPGYFDQCISIKNKIAYLKQVKSIDDIKFFNTTGDAFFATCDRTYDIIFIDADHSYKSVKTDYENALKFLNPGGIIIFHDINTVCGVKTLWGELDPLKKIKEFAIYKECGIGIYQP